MTKSGAEDRDGKEGDVIVSFASLLDIEILPGEVGMIEERFDEIVTFLDEIYRLDLEGVPPAFDYDPAWPGVNRS